MLAVYSRKTLIDDNGDVIDHNRLGGRLSEVKKKNEDFQRISLSEQVKYGKAPGHALAFRREIREEIVRFARKHNLPFDLSVGWVAVSKDAYFILNKSVMRYRIHSSNLSNPHMTIASRVNDIDFQVRGRREKVRNLQAFMEEYGETMTSGQRKKLKQAINTWDKSINLMENRSLLGLMLMLFNINPMVNRFVLANNFLCILRNH